MTLPPGHATDVRLYAKKSLFYQVNQNCVHHLVHVTNILRKTGFRGMKQHIRAPSHLSLFVLFGDL